MRPAVQPSDDASTVCGIAIETAAKLVGPLESFTAFSLLPSTQAP
jgi:hypothetical protein